MIGADAMLDVTTHRGVWPGVRSTFFQLETQVTVVAFAKLASKKMPRGSSPPVSSNMASCKLPCKQRV
jgi:hypothetical protein